MLKVKFVNVSYFIYNQNTSMQTFFIRMSTKEKKVLQQFHLAAKDEGVSLTI